MNLVKASAGRNFTAAFGAAPGSEPNSPQGQTSRINLSDLWVTPTYQVTRAYPGDQVFDPDWATELSHLLTGDPEKELDAVEVFELNGRYTLVHGYNRFGAYQLAGRLAIPAIVHPGGETEAMALALKANARPSKPQSADDKEKRVRQALAHYGPTLSNRAIAQLLDGSVSHPFVGKVKEKIETEATLAAIAQGQAPVIVEPVTTFTRNGATVTMNTTGLKKRATGKAAKIGKVVSLTAAPTATRVTGPAVLDVAARSPVIGQLRLTAAQIQLLEKLLVPEFSQDAADLRGQLAEIRSSIPNIPNIPNSPDIRY